MFCGPATVVNDSVLMKIERMSSYEKVVIDPIARIESKDKLR